MKKTILVTGLMLLLAAGPAIAQMMGSGSGMMGSGQDAGSRQQMMEQQQMQQNVPAGGQNYPQYMNRGMTGGYGMGAGMMGGYGYGMGPQMMGGYGHNPMHHMGGWGMPPCTQGPQGKSIEKHTKFMDDTRDERRKLHNMMFDYGEAMRSPEPDRQKLHKMEKEMYELRNKIFSYKMK